MDHRMGLDSRGILSTSHGAISRHRRVAREGRDPREVPREGLHRHRLLRPRPRSRPKKGIAVDRANGYKPDYQIVPGQGEDGRGADDGSRRRPTRIYLAADPDREGEAICWHLQELLKPEAPKATFHRAEFHEITKSAVTRAIENPGKISKDRVSAQQARRIIDRLVGYEVSELLWSKVWRGLSAGRVQTVALRIIVERESERERFVAIPYFSVPVTLAKGERRFPGARRRLAGRQAEVRRDATRASRRTRRPRRRAPHVAGARRCASCRSRRASGARTRRRPSRRPSCSRRAARSLGFSVRKTMPVAQRLYEGRTVGDAGHGRAHHLHAHGLGARRRGGARRRCATTSARPTASRALPAEARRYKPEEGRAGRARGDPADDARAAAGGGRALPRARRAQALPADLEPLRRLADEPVAERRDHGRHRGATRGLGRARGRCARPARCSRTRASCASTRRSPRPRPQNAPEDEADGDDAQGAPARARRGRRARRCARPRPRATRRSRRRASTRPRS